MVCPMVNKNDLDQPNWREEIQSHFDIIIASVTDENFIIETIDYTYYLLDFDEELLTTPEIYIGKFLKNEKEAKVLQHYCVLLDKIMTLYGSESYDFFIKQPEWQDLVAAARKAKEIIID